LKLSHWIVQQGDQHIDDNNSHRVFAGGDVQTFVMLDAVCVLYRQWLSSLIVCFIIYFAYWAILCDFILWYSIHFAL